MSKQLIYDSKTGEFRMKDPAILDPLNWEESYRKFIISEMKTNSYLELSTDLFGSHLQLPLLKIRFFEKSQLQIYILYKLRNDKKYRDFIAKLHQLNQDEFFDYIKNCYGSLIDKLDVLKHDILPPGYEELKKIKYGGLSAYSIEGYEDNRITYVPLPPYTIKVYSILFHYKDLPENKYLYAIWEEYTSLVEVESVSKKEQLEYTIKFAKDCEKYLRKR